MSATVEVGETTVSVRHIAAVYMMSEDSNLGAAYDERFAVVVHLAGGSTVGSGLMPKAQADLLRAKVVRQMQAEDTP